MRADGAVTDPSAQTLRQTILFWPEVTVIDEPSDGEDLADTDVWERLHAEAEEIVYENRLEDSKSLRVTRAGLFTWEVTGEGEERLWETLAELHASLRILINKHAIARGAFRSSTAWFPAHAYDFVHADEHRAVLGLEVLPSTPSASRIFELYLKAGTQIPIPPRRARLELPVIESAVEQLQDMLNREDPHLLRLLRLYHDACVDLTGREFSRSQLTAFLAIEAMTRQWWEDHKSKDGRWTDSLDPNLAKIEKGWQPNSIQVLKALKQAGEIGPEVEARLQQARDVRNAWVHRGKPVEYMEAYRTLRCVAWLIQERYGEEVAACSGYRT